MKNWKMMWKRSLSVSLALAMCLGMICTTTFAEETDCTVCDGTGVVACSTCEGTGRMEEMIPCTACTEGKTDDGNDCVPCNGTGEVAADPVQCPDCEGTGKKPCAVCGGTGKVEAEPEPEHQHVYEKTVTAPTCEADGYTTYTCTCGDSYTADETEATGHDWDEGQETEEGTLFTCKECGKTYIASDENLNTASLTGSGTETDPYGVSSEAELREAVEVGGYIRLDADIEMSETLVINSTVDLTLNSKKLYGTNAGPLLENQGTLTIGGDGFVYTTDIQAQKRAAILNYGNVTITGGTFGDSDNDQTNPNNIQRGVALNNLGTATVNGGYFTACDNYTNGGFAYPIVNGNKDDAVLTISNATVYGNCNGLVAADGGIVNVNGGSYRLGTGEQKNLFYMIYASGSGVVKVSGGNFTRNATTDYGYFYTDGEASRVEISGGNFENIAGDHTISAKGSGSVSIDGGTFKSNVTSAKNVLKITGGTFSGTVDSTYIAPGYVLAGGGTVQKDLQGSLDSVAKIDGQFFNSLQDAIDAAGPGDTVTLVKDVTECIKVSGNIILDLNGKTLKDDGSNSIGSESMTIWVASGGNLEVKGSGNVQITHNAGAAVFNQGTVKLSAGTYERPEGSQGYVFFNSTGGEMTFEQDVIGKSADPKSSLAAFDAGKDGPKGKVIINGGNYTSVNTTLKNDANSVLTINGGTFTTTGGLYSLVNYNEATVKDGNFHGRVWNSTGIGGVGELKVEGGTFDVEEGKEVIFVNNKDGSIVVSGGSFSKDASAYCLAGYGTTQKDGQGMFVFGEKEDGDFVAQIEGGLKYTTLQDAVTAANQMEAPVTINLLKPLTDDLAIKKGISLSKSMVINGDFTINGLAEGESAIAIDGDVVLTLSGNVQLTGGKNGAGIAVPESSKLTLNGSGSVTAIGNNGEDGKDADGTSGAGIGGTKAEPTSGVIVIEDLASLTAYGYSKQAAGIGSALSGGSSAITLHNVQAVDVQGGFSDGTADDTNSGGPEGGPAIGGGGKGAGKCGNITIENTTITRAAGGDKSAAIGSCFWSDCGTITIQNSKLTGIQGGGNGGAGIGLGRYNSNASNTVNIVIEASTIEAKGGAYGPAIGTSYTNKLGKGNKDATSSVSIADSYITAIGGQGAAGIGGGYRFGNVKIDIQGSTVYAEGGLLNDESKTLLQRSASAIGSGAYGSWSPGSTYEDKGSGLTCTAENGITDFYKQCEIKIDASSTVTAVSAGGKTPIDGRADTTGVDASILQGTFLTEAKDGVSILNNSASNTIEVGGTTVTLPAGYASIAVTTSNGNQTIKVGDHYYSYEADGEASADYPVASGVQNFEKLAVREDVQPTPDNPPQPPTPPVVNPPVVNPPTPPAPATYTITFVIRDGVENVVQTYEEGATVTAPTVETYTSGRYRYTFSGWLPELSATAQADATYTAQFTSTYLGGGGGGGGGSSYRPSSSSSTTQPTTTITDPSVPLSDQPILFTDVASDAYYADAVKWAVEQKITQGTSDTTFNPNGFCTRAQMVTFLWRAAGSPAPQGTANPFTDVKSDAYYYNAVLWAVEQGITKGISDTAFSPDTIVTRGQTVTFLHRAAGSPATEGDNPFTDVSDDAYYASAIQWALSKGVTTGTSATTFNPSNNCTRAQIVTFLYRDRAN